MRRKLGSSTELLLASCLVLFQELMFIRWLPSQVRVLAYFPNVVLISAFLGLGIGALMAKRRSVLWLWPIFLCLQVVVATALSGIAFTHESTSEHFWLLYYDLPQNAPVVRSIRSPIILLFMMNAAVFVPLGQFVAKRLQDYGGRGKALWGYCWDLLGSLAGIVLFATVSWLGFFPITWFAISFVLGAAFVGSRLTNLKHMGTACVGALLVLATVYANERALTYSPYYALFYGVQDGRLYVLTNGSLHQIGMGLQTQDPQSEERAGYHLPYRLIETPERVLVLGAGTGNDVAVLLDEGVTHIDAVEIDPEIIRIGKQFHPDNPYQSDRVTIYNTDARSYINNCEKSYDLIVFGTLDSMTRLSALSSVRLDNFVYTEDCVSSARNLLNPQGGMVFFFMVGHSFIDQHLNDMLEHVFGEPPKSGLHHFGLFNAIYMAGPAFAHVDVEELGLQSAQEKWPQAERLPNLVAPSDDWPYLYLKYPQLSGFYVYLIVMFAVIALVSMLIVSRELRRDVMSQRRMDLEMFLFGAAFLLIETKLVTEMNLVWGATWVTSAVVFGSILLMILAATVWTQLKQVALWLAFTGLIVSLSVTYLMPTHVLLVENMVARLWWSLLYAGSPIFFAALCFAARFKVRKDSDLAFGWNLLGAVIGGLVEFTSMRFGIKALTLFAIAIYLVVALQVYLARHENPTPVIE